MCTHKLSQATRASEAREGIENPKVSIPAENPCAGVYTQDTRKTPPGCVRRGVASEAREREDVRQRPEREKMCVRSQTERRCGLEVLHTRHTKRLSDGIMAPTNEVTRPTKRVCV